MDLFEDPVYQNSVKPFMLICAAILPSAYVIGLLFSLHTHADMVWKSQSTSKPNENVTQQVYPVQIIQPAQQEEPNEQTPLQAPANAQASVIQGNNG